MALSRVDTLFDSQATTIADCLYQEGAGLRIPPYQRMYAWDKAHIERLFVDLNVSLNELHSRNRDKVKSYSFLGTILLISESVRAKERSWRHAQSFEIVDGQQRLTTLALAIAQTTEHARILSLRASSEISDSSLRDFIKAETTHLIEEVSQCLARTNIRRPEPGKWVPAIVRSEDYRSYDDDFEYISLIGSVLHKFVIHIHTASDEQEAFSFDVVGHSTKDPEEEQNFQKRLDAIDVLVSALIEHGSVGEMVGESIQDLPCFLPSASSLFDSRYKDLRHLFVELRDLTSEDEPYTRALKESSEINDEKVTRLFRSLAVARYLLQHLVITVVKVDDDRYAYDIFEALNTTGEPLTALETFKPALVRYFGSTAWITEEAEVHFQKIERLVLNKKERSERVKAHNDLIIDSALLVSGEKRLNHISDQRSFLQSSLSDAEAVGQARVTDFVELLSKVAEFRSKFWKVGGLDEVLGECGRDAQLARLLVALFVQSNTSLAAPIIERYWIDAQEKNKWGEFLAVLKALAAFTVLRRSATTDTGNIDADFRKLMAGDASARIQPICFDVTEWRREPPSVNVFRDQCRHLLANSKAGRTRLGIVDFDTWFAKVRHNPVYSASRTISKFLLLAADQSTVEDDRRPYLRKKARGGRSDLLTFDFWRAGLVESIEHVAPVNRSARGASPGDSGWADGRYSPIYEDPKLLHTIGNLTLLPKSQNSDVSNLAWERKKALFEAFSAKDDEGIKGVIESAKQLGFPFSKAVTKRLLADDYGYNPLVSSIQKAPDWTLDILRQRTRNIAELGWAELSGWLGYE